MCYPTIDCISVAESLVSQLPDTPTNQFVHQIYGVLIRLRGNVTSCTECASALAELQAQINIKIFI